ncbi:Hypothetical protein CINCED_3A019362, partial [Cinara cedri]
MSNRISEFAQFMLENEFKYKELPTQTITTRILEPLEISASNESRTLSEISELSSPSELSDLSTASQLSPEPESSELFYSPTPREPTVSLMSSELTQSSVTDSSVPSLVTESSVLSLVTQSSVPPSVLESLVPSMPSTLTEPLLKSLSQVSSFKRHVNTVEPSIPGCHLRLSLNELANPTPVKTSTSTNEKETRLTTMSSSGLTEINGECDLTKTKTSTNKESTKLINQPSSYQTTIKKHNKTKEFGNESISVHQCQSLPVHNYVGDYDKHLYKTQYYSSSVKNSPSYSNSKHRPICSTSLFNSRKLLPHINYLLEKRRLFKKLNTSDEVCDDGISASSSLRNTSMESPGDTIVKSVERVKCISYLSTNGHCPQIEVVNNIINETIPTESENGLSTSKESSDPGTSSLPSHHVEIGPQCSNTLRLYQPSNDKSHHDSKPLASNDFVDCEESRMVKKLKETPSTSSSIPPRSPFTMRYYDKPQQLGSANNR